MKVADFWTMAWLHSEQRIVFKEEDGRVIRLCLQKGPYIPDNDKLRSRLVDHFAWNSKSLVVVLKKEG